MASPARMSNANFKTSIVTFEKRTTLVSRSPRTLCPTVARCQGEGAWIALVTVSKV